MSLKFTWDPRKAESNLKKHGVSFEEASTAVLDPLAVRDPDPIHEGRELVLGWSRKRRLLFVVVVEVVSGEVTRIISARRATSHERRSYESQG